MFIRVDNEDRLLHPFFYITPGQKKTISESDIVIISDYNKGYLSNSMIQSISKIANFVVIDTKRILEHNAIEHADFIKLNSVEYKNNKSLADEFPEKFIITKGRDGVKYNGKKYESSKPQDTIDVSGAGDTFTASFTLKYFLTKDIDESIRYANEVCADVVNKKGVSLPDSKFKL
jgi:bifunctional ADP-heptose synthase (sugar kinase/adenylyltransferase)